MPPASTTRKRRATLTADELEEPFVHVSTGTDRASAAELCVQVWLLGHPERRAFTNISISVEDIDE